MSENRWAVVASYSSRDEAELAASLLRANGVETMITADDLAGQMPALAVKGGVRLMVASKDAEAATQVLGAERSGGSEPAAQGSANGAPSREKRSSLTRPGMLACFVVGVAIGVAGSRAWMSDSDRGEHVYQDDTNSDGKSDETWVYRDGKLVSHRMDLNHDDRVDYWEFYDDGKYWRSEADRNFDGRLDYWTTNYHRLSQAVDWSDTDFNGVPDVESHYLHNTIQRSDWRPNGGTNIVKRELYSQGVFTEELHDRDGDGRFDFRIQFDFMGNPVSSNVIPQERQTAP